MTNEGTFKPVETINATLNRVSHAIKKERASKICPRREQHSEQIKETELSLRFMKIRTSFFFLEIPFAVRDCFTCDAKIFRSCWIPRGENDSVPKEAHMQDRYRWKKEFKALLLPRP